MESKRRNCDTDTRRANFILTLKREQSNVQWKNLDQQLIFLTLNITANAIKNTKKNSRSTGPDGISYLNLKHLVPHAVKALTNFCNQSLNNNSLPNIWK